MKHNTTTTPARKRIGKGWKITGAIAAAVLVVGMISSGGDSDTTTATSPSTSSAPTNVLSASQAAAPVAETVDTTPDVPREHSNALERAESYLEYSHFSYSGLLQQLTSEYGEGYTADAAQYAVDTVDVDWNAEAVEAAQSYLDYSSFSRDGLLQQLMSEYGEGFTADQAQYAVDAVY